MVYNIMPQKVPDPKILAKMAKINAASRERQRVFEEKGNQIQSLAHLAVRKIDPKDVPIELKEVANRARLAGRRTKRRKKAIK